MSNIVDSVYSRHVQEAVARDSEGGKQFVASRTFKAKETKAVRRLGRPVGSKSKPKGLVPMELADKFLDSVKPLLPPEHYQQMKDAVRNGKNISSIAEAKIMLKLMGPALMRRLINEYSTDGEIDPELEAEIGVKKQITFDRDTNERLKVWMDLLKIVLDLEEKENAATGHYQKKPLQEATIRRGIDPGRIKLLIGFESGSVGGNVNGDRGEALAIRAVSDSLSERQSDISNNEQGEAAWVLDYDSDRDDTQG